jgi:hypothetical protein
MARPLRLRECLSRFGLPLLSLRKFDLLLRPLHRTLLCLHLGVEVDGVQLKQQLTFDHHIADVDMNAQHPAWYATADALPLPHIKLTGATQGRCQ